MRQIFHGQDFIVLATLTFVSSCFHTGTAKEPVTLKNEFCALRSTLVPIDQPFHRHFPYYVTLSRCTGSVDYISPRYRSCVPATYDEIKIKLHNLENGQLTEINEKNHTSCKAGCTNKKELCDTQMETWDENSCACKCKYPDGPPGGCPVKFKWNSFMCACECDVDTQASLCLTEGKVWNSEKCGCDCPPRTVTRCQVWGRVLDEETCKCTSKKIEISAHTGQGKETGITKPMLFGIIFGELLLLLFLFDLILCLKGWGIMNYVRKSVGKAVSREKAETSPPLSPTSENSMHDRTTYC